jgi:nucleoside-diphosphate-sugar epimerase
VRNHLFCFGLGYVSNSLIKSLYGWKVSGTHSTLSKISSQKYLFNEECDLPFDKLDGVTHILISIPPTEIGDLVYLRLHKYLSTLKSLKWIGYFSSTSVYGDHQGAWVNEESAVVPIDIAGKNRLIAEEQWLSTDLPIVILRLSAIYGLGRSTVDMIRKGCARRIYKKDHCFSRIHVEDIVLIIKSMMNRSEILGVYNLADDFPCPQYELVDFACDLMNVQPPPMINFQDAELSDQMKKYYCSSKKIDNSKVKKAYNIKLKFSNYKDGISDLLKKDKAHA